MAGRVLNLEDTGAEGRYQRLVWMPLALRMKLDLAGLKISLADWQAISLGRRRALVAGRAEAEAEIGVFVSLLSSALQAGGRPAAASLAGEKRGGIEVWDDSARVPAEVAAMAVALGLEVAWPEMERFGRYVLYHFASKGDRDNFAAAVVELKVEESGGRP